MASSSGGIDGDDDDGVRIEEEADDAEAARPLLPSSRDDGDGDDDGGPRSRRTSAAADAAAAVASDGVEKKKVPSDDGANSKAHHSSSAASGVPPPPAKPPFRAKPVNQAKPTESYRNLQYRPSPPSASPHSEPGTAATLSVFKYWQYVASIRSMRPRFLGMMLGLVNLTGLMLAVRYVLEFTPDGGGDYGGGDYFGSARSRSAATGSTEWWAEGVGGDAAAGAPHGDTGVGGASSAGAGAASIGIDRGQNLLPGYGDLSCPLEDPLFSASALSASSTPPSTLSISSDLLTRGELARHTSAQSSAPQRISDAVTREEGGLEGRVVLVGDETMRQYFISMGCLGAIKEDAYVAPWRNPPTAVVKRWEENGQDASDRSGVPLDARFLLPTEGNKKYGEVLYSPLAGHVLSYFPHSPYSRGDPLVHSKSKSWLEACKNGEGFTLDTYAFGPKNRPGMAGGVKNLKLFHTDTVFLNAGTDPRTREANVRAITELLDCVAEAEGKGGGGGGWLRMGKSAVSWPKLRYVATTSSHYPPSPGIIGGAAPSAASCVPENYFNEYQNEDIQLFGERQANVRGDDDLNMQVLVGERVQLADKGSLHVGSTGGINEVAGPDCDSWLQPGVPDLVAAELVEAVAGVTPETALRTAAVADDNAVEAKQPTPLPQAITQVQPPEHVVAAMQEAQARTQAQESPQEQDLAAKLTQESEPPPIVPPVSVPQPSSPEENEATPPPPPLQQTQQQQTIQDNYAPPNKLSHLPTPEALRESCPFLPDYTEAGKGGLVNLEPDLLGTMVPFDNGLVQGLLDLLGVGGSDADGDSRTRQPKSVLDLAAGAGQLRSSLESVGALTPGGGGVDYFGFDQYLNIQSLVGRSVPLGPSKTSHLVPPLCWADPSRPFDLDRKFDLVLAIIGRGEFVREGWEGAFLDNLVRAAGDKVVVAWNTELHNGGVKVQKEMERRGMEYDGRATRRLRGSVSGSSGGGGGNPIGDGGEGAWLGKSLEVYRIGEGGTAGPLEGGQGRRQ